MTDCLILGYYDYSFEKYVEMTRSMGADTGAYRDVNLAYIDIDGTSYRALDIFSENHSRRTGEDTLFHNMDFLWPTIPYLGTFLHKNGFSFDYVNLIHLQKDKLIEKLQTQDILTVAVTTTLYVYPQPILEVISLVRKYNKKAKILVGGPYIGNQTQDADDAFLQGFFRQMGADVYVDSNEGEQALVKVIRAIKGEQDLNQVKNIAYRKGENFVVTQREIESNPLEENLVDYTLFPKHEFNQFVSLRTAKSCPFSCAFCGFPARAGAYKYLPVELVEKELNALRDLGVVTTITFLDDTFNVPKKRFKELLRMMIRNDYGFKWNSFYRSDHGDEETIELMAEAGCEGVFLGMESGSDRILKEMNKTARQKHYRAAIPKLKEVGIAAHASLVIGFPGETFETYSETVDFIEEIQPDTFRSQLWYADPVTPIWKRREELNIQGSAFKWSHYTMDSATAMELVERMFLTVENSVWLPQNGFEQWSLFYLQRHGMSLSDIKTYLNSFNQVIKDKLVYPDAPQAPAHLIEQLAENSRLDGTTDFEPTYAGADYKAAEAYWVDAFSDEAPAVTPDGDMGQMEQVRCELDTQGLNQLVGALDADLSRVLLSAYATLLSRINGVEDLAVQVDVAAKDEQTLVPLRLKPQWDEGFDGWTQRVSSELATARSHQTYAARLVLNDVLMKVLGAVAPALDVAFLFRGEGRSVEADRWRSEAWDRLKLRLEVVVENGVTTATFTYSDGHYERDVVEGMADAYCAIIDQLHQDPHTALGEMLSEPADETPAAQDDLETFSF